MASCRRLLIRGLREIRFPKLWPPIRNIVLPYEQLAVLAVQAGTWQDVEDNTNQALQLDPSGTPQLWYYDALAKFQLGETDKASASASKSLAIDPRHSVLGTEQLLAVIMARKADYAGALQHLRQLPDLLPRRTPVRTW